MSDNVGGNRKFQSAVDPFDLAIIEAAVNEGARRTQVAWLGFLSVVTYLLISVTTVSHRNLFFETPVRLPLLNIDLPLTAFFVASPILLATLHFYLLLQVQSLSRALTLFCEALLRYVPVGSDRRRIAQRLHGSVFIHALLPASFGVRWEKSLYRFLSIATVVVLPLVLAVFLQTAFLPYHSIPITYFHRAMILVETVLAGSFIALASGIDSVWPRGKVGRMLRASLYFTVFAIFLMVLGFSFAVSTFPGEPIYEAAKEGWIHARFTAPLFEGNTNFVVYRATSPFSNRLVLADQILVDLNRLQTERISTSVRGRDFRGAIFDRADLRYADFTGAMLSEATFLGANLQNSRFGCADTGSDDGPPELREFADVQRMPSLRRVSDDEQYGNGCVILDHAYFKGARLQAARLIGARGLGVNFDGADLTGANLMHAYLPAALIIHAVLDGAKCDEIDLTGAFITDTSADGASFRLAKARLAYFGFTTFNGASFDEADMTGTKFLSAGLRGSTFVNTTLVGVDFGESALQASSFVNSDLRGASLVQAQMEGVNLECVLVYRTEVALPLPNFVAVARPDPTPGYAPDLLPRYFTPQARLEQALRERRECAADASGIETQREKRPLSNFEQEIARILSTYDDRVRFVSSLDRYPPKERPLGTSTAVIGYPDERGSESWTNAFFRLRADSQTDESDKRDADAWHDLERASLSLTEYHSLLATTLSDLICTMENGRFAALGLMKNGRLGDIGDNLDKVIGRWADASRSESVGCPGAKNLSPEELDRNQVRKLIERARR